jgi:phosphoribosyl-dephospho-CoA transferase
MSISDGFAILNGNDTSATHFLREKTYTSLKERFSPTVTDAINKVKVTSYWSPLISTYNKIPGIKPQNPNLNEYVTDKAINGLMTLIAQEETKIRKDPMARVTDILKKVFGSK